MELTNPTNLAQILRADVHQHRQPDEDYHSKGRRKTPGNSYREVFFLRSQKGHEIQVRVDVTRSRRRHHQSLGLRIRNFPVRKTPWKISIKILMPPRRRDHHGLRQTQNIQG